MRQAGRRRGIRKIKQVNRYWGYGPQAEDAVSGWLRPISLMTRQRGVLVSQDQRDESLDRPKEW